LIEVHMSGARINSIEELERVAREIRRLVVRMAGTKVKLHLGGSLSMVEIITALYFRVMRHDPQNPGWPERDRFILSKGHACPAYYAALALAGYFPIDALWTFRSLDSILQGHPDMRKTPGVEASSGSLGQGLSVGIGMALAARLDRGRYHIYVLMSDGEANEGQVWEAAQSAAQYKLSNLTLIVDKNGFSASGPMRNLISVEPLAAKWRDFGWAVFETDGHSFSALLAALDAARQTSDLPSVVIATTVKGKGVSFMENATEFHSKLLTEDEYTRAMEALDR